MTVLLDDTTQTARKAHTCDACLGTIAAGDTYRRQRMIEDGDPGTYKCHLLCDWAYWHLYRELELLPGEAVADDEIVPLLGEWFGAAFLFAGRDGGGADK